MKTVWIYAALIVLTMLGLEPWKNWAAFDPGDFMQWSLALFLFALEMAFIFFIWLGTHPRQQNDRFPLGINLEKLISESDGAASFSRFQFLIFTFVVASGYVVQVFMALKSSAPVPDIPNGVLALIGISGGSYVVSKGIEKSTGDGNATGSQTTPSTLPGEVYKP